MSNKVYEIITEKILEKLDQGVVPWHRPWKGGELPMNLVSKKEYRGFNVFILACSGYTSPYWVSYKQAQELGGNVKKGEKSTMVIFWKQLPIQEKTKDNEGSEKIVNKTIPLLRYYRVFNTEQCEGFEEKIPALDTRQDFHPIKECEKALSEMPNRPEIQCKDQRAYYIPSQDIVNMPRQELFDNDEEYYSTFFHELTHSTGHKSRLDRHQKNKCNHIFGSKDYSKEELVAEMGAAFLCGHTGIENKTIDNSAAYIQGWSKKFKENIKMVVLAAAQAQKAADYILGNPIVEY